MTPRSIDRMAKETIPTHHGSMSIGQLAYLNQNFDYKGKEDTKSTLDIKRSKMRLLSPNASSEVAAFGTRYVNNGRAQTANRAKTAGQKNRRPKQMGQRMQSMNFDRTGPSTRSGTRPTIFSDPATSPNGAGPSLAAITSPMTHH